MNAEYQRLEAEASEVQQQINQLVSSCNQMAAAEFQKRTKGSGLIVFLWVSDMMG